MPFYTYQHPETGEQKDVLQKMNEEHIYEENGVLWNRVYTVPGASIDTKIDPFSSKSFVQATNKKGGTVGELMDRAAEMSQKRADKEGVDSVKQKAMEAYAKDRPAVRQKMKGSSLA